MKVLLSIVERIFKYAITAFAIVSAIYSAVMSAINDSTWDFVIAVCLCACAISFLKELIGEYPIKNSNNA
jgi:hypothetical protein